MESTISEFKWYVLRVMGGKEKKTRLFIEKEVDRLKLNDFVSRILIPTEKVFQIWKNSPKRFFVLPMIGQGILALVLA